MRGSWIAALMFVVAGSASAASAQVVLTGRLRQPRFAGSNQQMPLSAVMVFASRRGPGNQALAFRTWETHPAGWYRMSGGAGNYTLVFSTPAHFMRPIVQTNLYARSGDVLDRVLSPAADYAVFHEGAWDNKPARGYCQVFVAKGTGVTHVGFRLAHDGVDGSGPGKQNLLVSIRRRGKGAPDTWPQVGPTAVVVGVDSGGAKNYIWSAGWNSGEVPLRPGETYAVHLRAEAPAGRFQAFWRPTQGEARCYRVGERGGEHVRRELWLSVGTDGDGLVIPYHKRVHKEFRELTKFARKWSQTYVARGRSAASVILYAATSGVQPRIARQRVAVRFRRGGPGGPRVGVEKIAIGEGCYTGDASWGAFGAAFAPGEVPLEPGQTYAVEFETLESYHTLHGFVNAKGQVSDDRPGFNPYRKHPRDPYAKGAAYLDAARAVEYDLDMQVIEYEFAATDWAEAVEGKNLLVNGDMERGKLEADKPAAGRAAAWRAFTVGKGVRHLYTTEGPRHASRFLRLAAATGREGVADGGFVQRVDGLSRLETYRLRGKVRSSWAVDEKRQCRVGWDPTGQDTDPAAETIVWTVLPGVHGAWVPFAGQPIRPGKASISVWLRGRAAMIPARAFRADFDDFVLRKVSTGAARAR